MLATGADLVSVDLAGASCFFWSVAGVALVSAVFAGVSCFFGSTVGDLASADLIGVSDDLGMVSFGIVNSSFSI